MRTTRPLTFKSKVAAAAATGLLTVGLASPAFAWIEVGGGRWAYAVSICCNWSDYQHDSVNHGSSVKNSQGIVRSDCVSPGITAHASETADITGNEAFWRHC